MSDSNPAKEKRPEKHNARRSAAAALGVALTIALSACSGSEGTTGAIEPTGGSRLEQSSPSATAAPTPTPAGAVETNAADVVKVTGDTGVPLEVPGQWSGDPPEGAGTPGSHLRGLVYRGTLALSDERVSGQYETTVNVDLELHVETVVGYIWGTATITNDRGTWEGSVTGTTSYPKGSSVHTHELHQILLGTGEYEGLQFIELLEGTDYPWTITGSIEPVD
jgi:hypothetical protein